MKGVGMLVVSLKGINLRFWSHLGCSGQNAIIFSREGLVQGLNSKFPTSIPTFHMRYAECPPPPPGLLGGQALVMIGRWYSR